MKTLHLWEEEKQLKVGGCSISFHNGKWKKNYDHIYLTDMIITFGDRDCNYYLTFQKLIADWAKLIPL